MHLRFRHSAQEGSFLRVPVAALATETSDFAVVLGEWLPLVSVAVGISLVELPQYVCVFAV